MLARLLAVFVLLASAAQERRLSVPEWAGKAQCTVGTNRQVASTASTIAIDCDGKNEVVSCSFERGEPIDLPKADACQLTRLAVRPSIEIRLRATDFPVKAEWLELNAGGELVSLAARDLPVKGEATIQVAPSPNRYLRFIRPSASPVTVSADELTASSPWSLPTVARGGELVIDTVPSKVMPSSYVVRGAAQREVIRNQRLVSVPALLPGEYLLTPVYSSGMSGSPRAFKVANGATSNVSIAPEPVGAVRVTVSSNACRPGDFLVLTSVKPDAANESAVVKPVGHVPLTQCVVVLNGIQPGLYKSSVRSNGNTMVTKDVQINVQQIAEVLLDVESVMVTGRVTLNAKPFAGVTLQFVHLPDVASGRSPRDPDPLSAGGIKATTGSDGSYMTFLGSRGSYAVTPKWGSAQILGQEKELEIESDAGSPVLDMAMVGGFLELHVSNWDRKTSVLIDLRRTGEPPKPVGGTSLMGVAYHLKPGDELPIRIPAIPFGEYVVNARQSGEPTKVTPRQQVKLDPDHANVRVDLPLAEQRSTLRVVDESGQPLDNVTVMGGVVTKTGQGEFNLSKVIPGAKIHIKAPGFVPACRAVDSQGELYVELSRGRTARVDYLAAGSMSGPDGFLELPGSDCPVNIYHFQFERSMDGPPDSSSFVFSNFPTRGRIITPSGSRVEIPPTGGLSLRWK